MVAIRTMGWPILADMTNEEWHSQLAATFTVSGLIGGRLVEVQKREQDIGVHLASTYRGQNALLDAFQSYYVETLNLIIDGVSRNGWPINLASYSLTVACFLSLFRRFRSCEILFYNGYPLDGYSLFRDIKDRAVMLAGVVLNMTTLPKALGVAAPVGDRAEWHRQRTRLRRAEEHRISKRILGSESGLSDATVSQLRHWDALFHSEVHGGTLSLTNEIEFLSKGMLNLPGPSQHRLAFTVYMNRSAELGWLILRLLPYLQPTASAFGSEWQRKYEVLDESFRHMVGGLVALGKEIGPAFIALVDGKFAFKQPFHYFDADGKA